MSELRLEDQTAERKYFTTVPNIVDDLTTCSHDASVYRAMLRCAGGAGKTCYASTRRIAEIAKVSIGQVSKSKQALIDLGFVEFAGRKPAAEGGQKLDHYRLPDLWPRNMQRFAEIQERSRGEHLERSSDEQERSPGEQKRSRGETKKGSSRKEPVEREESPTARIVQRVNDLRRTNWKWASFRPFSASHAKNIEHINGRLRDGFSEPQLILVAEYLAAKDGGDEKSRQFFDCVTPFRVSNFERFLAMAEDWDARGRPSFNGDHRHPGTSRPKEYYLAGARGGEDD